MITVIEQMRQFPHLSIGDVAARVGLRTSAIRFYERRGLLPTPERINGRRRYNTDVVGKIHLIRLAQQAGLTIEEIRVLLHGFPADTSAAIRWNTLANRKLDEVNALLERIAAMKALLEHALECQCATLDDCASGLDSADGELTIQQQCAGSRTGRPA
ncbi:MAG TPA: MerR family transcriptional regulator [Aggregatilineales bacterium]|nr:MerR family transcriptional regulator [Aggregatilineales bacterium]